MIAILKKHWPSLFIIINLIAVVIVVVLDPELRNIGIVLHTAEHRWLFFALAATVIYTFLDGFAQHRMIQRLVGKQSVFRWLKITLLASYYNAITPFSSGGQPILLMHMHRYGIPFGYSSYVVFFRYFTYQIAMFCVTVVAFILQGPAMIAQSKMMFAAFLIGAIVNFVLPFLLYAALRSKKAIPAFFNWISHLMTKWHLVRSRDKLEATLDKHLADFRTAFSFEGRKTSDIIWLFVCGLVQVLALGSVAYCVYRALGLQDALYFDVAAMTLLLIVSVSYMPTPGASGASEGGFYLLFTIFFPRSLITLGMLLWRLFTYYAILAMGAICLLAETITGRWNRSKSV